MNAATAQSQAAVMAPTLTDLTMPLREGIAAYASHGRSVLELIPVMRHTDFAGKGRFNSYDAAPVSFEVSQWLIGDQAGTHMDAPWHADADSELTIDRVPLDVAFGPAIWIDCTADTSGSGITVETMEAGLAGSGLDIGSVRIVLLRTGASDLAVSDPQAYANHAVGLTKAAAEWLRAARVKLVGIDCVTVECPSTVATADVHTNFLKPSSLGLPQNDIIGIIENLVGIDCIPSHQFTFAGFPLPFVGAAGSPLRAVAIS